MRAKAVGLPTHKTGRNFKLTRYPEKAWRSVNKTITIGEVTVKVRAFGR
jgi:hypothetical protein